MAITLILLTAQFKIRNTDIQDGDDLNDSMVFDTIGTPGREDKEA